jgi:hypothetical protein
MVHVPLNNWFDTSFNLILNKVIDIIKKNPGDYIILTSCGMSAKVLLTELYKKYPNFLYFDIGSGIDTICTKRSTREKNINYEYCYHFFKEILPENWEDDKYKNIYTESHKKLGLHIPK